MLVPTVLACARVNKCVLSKPAVVTLDVALSADMSPSPQPEAANLVSACLAKEPGRRPALAAVLAHPLWWGEERRLAFLVDISDRWGARRAAELLGGAV